MKHRGPKRFRSLKRLQSLRKSRRLIKILTPLLGLAIFGCSIISKKAELAQSTPVYPDPSPPPGFKNGKLHQITNEGVNLFPSYSPDGAQLLYQSTERSSHRSSQIYIYNVSSGREKRFTYNAGENWFPHFGPAITKQVIYSSSMDEILENASVRGVKPDPTAPLVNWLALPFEIYTADIDGSHIHRITNHSSYDGEGVFSRDGKHIAFASARAGNVNIYVVTIKGKAVRRLTTTAGYDGSPRFSADGKMIAWHSFSPDFKESQIWVSSSNGPKKRQLTTLAAINAWPAWSPDGKTLVFSSNRADHASLELYTVSVDGKCLKRLTYLGGSEKSPEFSPDGKQVVFSSDRSGKYQIYTIDYEEPKDCLSEAP